MVIYKKVNKYYLPALFFLILSLLLIFAWFKDGHLYGGGDVGLPTYNPIRIFQIARYIWWEAVAPGFLIPQAITSITLYFFLSFFQLLGLGPLGIQAILFCTLLFFMGFGMYLLTLSIIGRDKKIYATLAGLFYMFNPYMMTQIWHRFTHTSMFFVAALPFLILFWRLWIKSGNYLYLLYFLLVNLLASYMFGTIAFVFPFWLIMSLFTVSEIFLPWENKSRSLKVLWRSLFGLVIWILVNSWWLMPVATIGSGVASQQHDIRGSIFTLVAISKQAILPYSLQMVNSYYVFDQAELGEIYKSFFFRLIPWLGVSIIFYGIICALKRKYLASLVLIYLVIIMLAKGTSTPFGQPFLLLFSKFFALGLLRNPFEKLGILLPLVSSILFVLGIEGLFSWFGKYLGNLGKKMVLLMLITVMGVYYWPMYKGTIFGIVGKPNYVEIPQTYLDANLWLNQKVNQDSITDGKILHLPLTRSDVATYRWKNGYHGIESSASLFTALPSISHGVNLKRIDDPLTALSLIFHKPYYEDTSKILKLLQDFNVRFIILHKDMDWLGGDTYNPFEAEKVLNNLSFIKKEAEFGNLVVYKVAEEFFGSKIEIPNNISLVYPQKSSMQLWPWLASEKDANFLSPVNDRVDETLKSKASETLIFPENAFSYPQASSSSLENTTKQLTTQLNILLGAAQYVKQLGTMHTKTEATVQNIILASQKLIEGTIREASIDEYSNLIDKIFPELDDNSTLYFDVAKTTIGDILKLHEITLSVIGKGPDTLNRIREFLIKEKTFPLFVYKGNVSEAGERQLYNFSINSDGRYELILTNSKIKDAYLDKLSKLNLQINNEAVTLSGKEVGNILTFGEIGFKKGLNEISLSTPSAANLISSPNSLTKIGNINILKETIEMSVSKNNPSAIGGPLLQTSGEDIFKLSFDAIIPANVGLYIQIIQDTDNEQNGQKVPRISFLQHLNQFDWQGSYNIKLPALSISTREAKIRLIALIPPEVSNFNTTSVEIKNLRLIRILNNQILLRAVELNNEKKIVGTIDFKRKNAVEYEGNLRLTRPGFVFFKEAYDPGWELELRRDNKVFKPYQHYIGYLYGNAWWVEEPGEYNFKIEFKPQQKVTLGIYLGLAGLLGVILLIVRSKIKKNL
ncbi:MAG: Uncharacterized protein G01um10147_457 [Microgenomates group bacterium Gr01-1014_7]|nr:MAG: Uncharacterized protein G01um10147_457 [Microgenomates group bacterium Gr01-1014_7]